MSYIDTVHVLTQTDDNGNMEILAVFKDQDAAETRILNWVRQGKMEKLKGLKLTAHTVMNN